MKNRAWTDVEYFLIISFLPKWRNISKSISHGEKRERQNELCLKLMNVREELNGRTEDGIRQCFIKADRITLGDYDYNKLRDIEKVFFGIHRGLEDIL